MTVDLDPEVYDLIEKLIAAMTQTNVLATFVLPTLGILVSLAAVFVAIWVARASNAVARRSVEVAKQSAAIAERALEIDRRNERRRFGDAAFAYYDSRREDIVRGTNWNMPHWTFEAEAAAAQINEPNTEKLLSWLTDTIDQSFKEEPSDRGLNALWLRSRVETVIASWVGSPEAFDPAPMKFWADYNAERQ